MEFCKSTFKDILNYKLIFLKNVLKIFLLLKKTKNNIICMKENYNNKKELD
jgi:hypothetical protein